MANNTAKSVTLTDKNTGDYLYPYTSDSLVKRTNSTYETVQEALDALEAGSTSREGYVIAKTASDFMDENTIYEIRDEINLGGNTLEIPANSVLKFEGGKLTNGTVKWEDTLLEGQVSMENIDVYEAPCSYRPNATTWANEIESAEHKLANDVVYVDWFGTYGDGVHDDSRALVAAVKSLKRNGVTLVFGEGKTYLHGDGLTGTDGTGNQYTFVQYYGSTTSRIGNPSYLETGVCASDSNYIDKYNQALGTSITAASATIGRKIRLDFNRFKSLKILGNSSTILSNPNNGIVFNNSMLDFYYCSGVCIENLTIDGNRTNRLANLRTHWTSIGHSEWQYYIDYGSGKGYVDFHGIAMQGCSNINLNCVSAINSPMNNLTLNAKTSNSMCRRANVQNCQFKGAYRNSITLGGIDGVDISNCYFEDNGIDGISPGNHIDTEIEVSDVSSGRKNYNIFIKNSHFIQNLQNSKINGSTLQLRSKINFNTASDGPIVMENCIVTNSTFVPQSPNARISNCTFTNCRMNLGGNSITDHCVLNYTKDLWKYTIDGTEYNVQDRDGSFPLVVSEDARFTNNIFNWSTDLKKRTGCIMRLSGVITNNVFNDLCGMPRTSSPTYKNCEFTKNLKTFSGNVMNAPSDYQCETGEQESSFYCTFNSQTGVTGLPHPIYADNNVFDSDIIIPSSISDKLLNIINGSSSTQSDQTIPKGTTAERPDLDPNEYDYFEYYDTDLKQKIYLSTSSSPNNVVFEQAYNVSDSDSYLNNPLEEGKYYFVEKPDNASYVFKFYFRKEIDSTEDEIQIFDAKGGSTGKWVKAPDPTVYKYIYTYNGAAGSAVNRFVVTSSYRWIDNDGFTAVKHIGTTSERPDIIDNSGINPLWDNLFPYYDTDLNSKILYTRKITESVKSIKVSSNYTDYFSQNTLLKNTLYKIHMTLPSTVTSARYFDVSFTTSDDPTDSGYKELKLRARRSTDYHHNIIAPDPEIYPYIKVNATYGYSTNVFVIFDEYKNVWIEEDGATAGVARSGDTRPDGSDIYVGFEFFDTTLSKPIYASVISGDTVTWVDATGTTIVDPE